jgi:hypothetical protein
VSEPNEGFQAECHLCGWHSVVFATEQQADNAGEWHDCIPQPEQDGDTLNG